MSKSRKGKAKILGGFVRDPLSHYPFTVSDYIVQRSKILDSAEAYPPKVPKICCPSFVFSGTSFCLHLVNYK